MLTSNFIHKWKLGVKNRFSRVFTQHTERYGYTALNLRQNGREVALMSLNKFLKHIWSYMHPGREPIPLNVEFHKFESQNIRKICGFQKYLCNDYGGHLGSQVPLTTSDSSFLHIRTHILKDLSLHQILKIAQNHIFGLFKHFPYLKFSQQVLPKCWPKCYPQKFSSLRFQTHHQTSSYHAFIKKYVSVNLLWISPSFTVETGNSKRRWNS